jgi:hypothetical protein
MTVIWEAYVNLILIQVQSRTLKVLQAGIIGNKQLKLKLPMPFNGIHCT